jgi:hypothetical protein
MRHSTLVNREGDTAARRERGLVDTGTKQLVAAVGELDTTCKTNDAASFEAAFAKVHESLKG